MTSAIRDQAQRDQALNPRQSFIVQAPAGSGKTELLTQRFLRLLACVNEPEEILAITFTKKAASEMRSRIRDALRKAALEPLPAAEHAQKTWHLAKNALQRDQERHWGLLSNPNRLRIKTIDAFNSLLTRQLPLLSHLGAAPDIMDFPNTLYREAVQTFLTHLEENVTWSNALARLLLHLDNNMENAEKLLIEMLSKRDQWLPHLFAYPALREALEANLCAVIEETLQQLQTLFPLSALPELLSLLHFACGNLRSSNPTSPLLRGEVLDALPGTHAEDLPLWLTLAEFLLTQEGSWRKLKGLDKRLGFPAAEKSSAKAQDFNTLQKQKMQALIDELCSHEQLHQTLIELRHLPDAHYSETQWDILKALYEVLKIEVAQLQVVFKLTGKIDYTENALAALLALGTEEAPTDLALVLDYQLKHILVDEFQDTSSSQYALLKKLVHGWQAGDGRSLFLVGDPMQSIYRFREAEVGLFLRAREQGLGPIPLQALTLSVNFRATSSVVDWLNSHFNRVLPPYDDIANSAVSYTPSVSSGKAVKPEETGVHLQVFSRANPQAQTQGMIRLIQEALQNNPQDTIAILVRSRSHLKALIPALKNANLPYQAVAIDPLETRPLIQDLLALTRALLYPADPIAWFAILRAPWCGLCLADLLALTCQNKQEVLWERLLHFEENPALSSAGKKRLQRILPVLKTAIAERHREDLPVWVEKTWLALGGPACLDTETELQDAKIYFELLKKLSQEKSSLYLKWPSLEEALTQLYAKANAPADCRLQIMTIHNAKGLEFDTVILPHLEKGTHKNDKPLLTWLERPLIDHRTALLLAPIHATFDKEDKTYEHIRRQDKNKSQHELGRLLYVAATRAKKNLHLCFSLDATEEGQWKQPTEGSLLKKLWPAIHEKLGPSTLSATPVTNADKTTLFIKRLHDDWRHPVIEKPAADRPVHNKIQGFHLITAKEAPILGTVVHYLLQQISRFSPAWWQEKSSTNKRAYLQLLFVQNGLLAPQAAPWVEKAEKALANALADPRGQWLLQARPETEAEYSLTAVFAGKVKTLIIDKTFVDENGLRWIIDYKTATPDGQGLSSFLEHEKQIYTEKMQEYHQAFTLLDPRPIRLGLYFPLVPAWCEWENTQVYSSQGGFTCKRIAP